MNLTAEERTILLDALEYKIISEGDSIDYTKLINKLEVEE